MLLWTILLQLSTCLLLCFLGPFSVFSAWGYPVSFRFSFSLLFCLLCLLTTQRVPARTLPAQTHTPMDHRSFSKSVPYKDFNEGILPIPGLAFFPIFLFSFVFVPIGVGFSLDVL